LLAVSDPALARRLDAFRTAQTERVLALKLPGSP
jgi:phosphoribosylcarboxyaminoimidazole (NCAIR) mutase